MIRDPLLYIDDILESIGMIGEYVAGGSKETFEDDRQKIDAVCRRIEIIGEAVKGIPESIKAKHKEIPWKDISGMRDILAHGYFKVNIGRIWDIVNDDLPELEEKMSALKAELEAEEKQAKENGAKNG